MAKVITNEREISLFGFNVPDPANRLNSFVIGNITPQPINSIRRVNDQAAFTQHLHYLFDSFWIRVFGVDFYKHWSNLISDPDSYRDGISISHL